MTDGCVDCRTAPTLQHAVYTETFPVAAPSGLRYQLTLRLCLACGSRFADRREIREYLRTRLPAHATTVAETAAAV